MKRALNITYISMWMFTCSYWLFLIINRGLISENIFRLHECTLPVCKFFDNVIGDILFPMFLITPILTMIFIIKLVIKHSLSAFDLIVPAAWVFMLMSVSHIRS
jgi:hypothetical protein